MNTTAILCISITILLWSCKSQTANTTQVLEVKPMEILNSDSIYKKISITDESYTEIDDDQLSGISDIIFDLHKEEDISPASSVQLLMPSRMSFSNKHHFFLMGRVVSGKREWEALPKTNTHFFLKNKETGQAWIATPFVSNRRGAVQPRSKGNPKPHQSQLEGWSAGFQKVDLAKSFPPNLPLGEYTGTVLYYDLPSISRSFVLYDKNNASSKTPSKTTLLGVEKVEIKTTKENITLNIDFITSQKETSNNDIMGLQIKEEPASKPYNIASFSLRTWKGNIIALKLDEKPIVIPVSKELGEADAKSITLEIPFQENNQLKEGEYQMYVDVGDRMKGPFEIHIAP